MEEQQKIKRKENEYEYSVTMEKVKWLKYLRNVLLALGKPSLQGGNMILDLKPPSKLRLLVLKTMEPRKSTRLDLRPPSRRQKLVLDSLAIQRARRSMSYQRARRTHAVRALVPTDDTPCC
jgi:hypothetical protein